MHPNFRFLATLAFTSLAAANPSGARVAETFKVPSAAFPTIAAAVTAANSGDTIQIAPNNANGSDGVYSEVIVVPNTKTGLHFKGANVTWDGAGANNILTFTGPNDNVIVEGIIFRNGNAQLTITGDHATVTKCQFVSSQGNNSLTITGNFASVTNITVHGGKDFAIGITGTDAFVDKCTIAGVGFSGVNIAGGDRAVVSHCSLARTSSGIVVAGDTTSILSNTITNNGGAAIATSGLAVVIEGNKISGCSGSGIICGAGSNDAKILGNTISTCESTGIQVDGAHAAISKNKIDNVQSGISVANGNTAVLGGPTISANTIKTCRFGTAISIGADSATILTNTIDRTLTANIGITVTALGVGTQGGSIANNKISNVGASGIVVTANSFAVSQNKISHCGRSLSTHAGLAIVGNGCSLLGNTVSDTFGDGYQITGNTNTVTDCKASNCTFDGIDIVAGDLNTVDDCTVTHCLAEGLDNSAGVTNTVVKNSNFSKCRIDFAGNATLSTDLNNTFTTGGAATAPVID